MAYILTRNQSLQQSGFTRPSLPFGKVLLCIIPIETLLIAPNNI